MTVHLLASVFLLLTGILAGTLFTVEVAIVPTLKSLPGERWVQVHTRLDKRFDPMMPSVNKVSLVICAVLVILAHGIGAKAAFALGGLGTVGVALVSEFFNVRMNKHVVAWDPAALPPGWQGLRERWAAANRVRTLLAVAGFVSTIVGAALL
ncbi:MAG: hypothetical protein AUG49_22980 [Catenulispora sp. 13_1_20CM_3_70_7]|jgi:uncharacterized membrane protein|nr:MAG: hypothetical protein AUG49_22980 [Catenulispora sp. 13_1_20CM_3_70_7]